MINCHEVTRLYSASQERPLTLNENVAVKMHVMLCSGCRNFGKQMQTLRVVARSFAKGRDEPAGGDGN